VGLGAQDAFRAIGFRAGVGNLIALTIVTDDEHRTAVALAFWLVGSEHGRRSAMRSGVPDALTEAAMAELVSAAEKFNRVVGVVRSEGRLHGAEVLVAERKNIRPHRQRV
jgi:hypothetical protein